MPSTMTAPAAPASAAARRAYWLKTLHHWHWISAALSLVGMILFAFTGITLNHAGDIEAKPRVMTRETQLPPALQAAVAPPAEDAQGDAEGSARDERRALPAPVRDWLAEALDATLGDGIAEWSPDEVYLPLPRPGGDAWLRIERESGAVEYERTDRGWIAYLNDLHKGRHAGTAWSWFIDLFSVACLVFAITGLLILKLHAAQRPNTWPIVGLGLVLPLLLAILFIH